MILQEMFQIVLECFFIVGLYGLFKQYTIKLKLYKYCTSTYSYWSEHNTVHQWFCLALLSLLSLLYILHLHCMIVMYEQVLDEIKEIPKRVMLLHYKHLFFFSFNLRDSTNGNPLVCKYNTSVSSPCRCVYSLGD